MHPRLLAGVLAGFCVLSLPREGLAHINVPRPPLRMPESTLDQMLPRQQEPGNDWIRFTVDRGDSISTLFTRAGLPTSDWVAVDAMGEDADPLRNLQPGDEVDILPSFSGHLEELRLPLDALATLVIRRHVNGLDATVERKDTQLSQQTLTGQIDSNLSDAIDQAGGSAVTSLQLARIFGKKIDLTRDLRKGDQFSVIYEQYLLDGKPVQTGDVVAAKLTVNGHLYQAFRYTDKDGRVAYYDEAGHPYEPSILRAPVHYTRISSSFSRRRLNPVLHIWRAHYGTDYAAPAGTPIEAAADGTVAFVGRQHGYGRIVELNHFEGYSTRYAHMSAFADHLHKGEHVVQGEIIGYVGASGEATGPHLHFEIRRNGTPYNPQTVALPEGHLIASSQMPAFSSAIKPMVAQLEQSNMPTDTLVASNAGSSGDAVPSDCSALQPLSTVLSFATADQDDTLERWICGSD